MGKVTGEEGWRSLGLLGTARGARKTYKADGPILQITLRLRKNNSGRVLSAIPYSISFESESCNGTVIGSSEHFGNPEHFGDPKQGGDSGEGRTVVSTVRINTLEEQLQSIKVLGKEFAYLTFYTNLKRKYGPYGYSEDYRNDRISRNYTEKDRVSLEMKGGVIAGFYGYEDSGGRLSGLGVFVVPKEDYVHIQDPYCAQHQKTEIEELKTKIKELEAEKEVLKKRNKKMEKEKIEIEELKTKIKELEAENEVPKKRNKEMEKEALKTIEPKESSKSKKKDSLSVELSVSLSALAESSKKKVDILEAKDKAKSTSVSVTSQDHGEPQGLLAKCIKTLNAMKDLDGASYTKGMKLLKDVPSWRPIFLDMSEQRKKDFISHL